MSDASLHSSSSALHHYDDPRSQIRFLELTLGDREWRASIHLPPKGDPHGTIAATLRNKGYKVTPKQHEDGSLSLELHHFGKAPDIPSLFKQYGLTYGTGYLIENPSQALRAAGLGVSSGAQKAGQIVRDPARLNGITYLTAEAFLMRAAGGNPHGKWYQPKNLLQGLSAAFYMSQSLAYLFWARKGDERIETDLAKQLRRTENDESFEALANAAPLNERAREGALGKVRGILEDHPIETGAAMNNAGMVAYIGHALLERKHRLEILKTNPNDIKALKYVNKGFWAGLIGSSVSIAGWSSLLLKSKSYDEYSDNALVRMYQKWRENPQSTAGASTLISSSGRLWEAYNKGNTYQMIGESIYIPGDVMLFFVKNHEYGGSIGSNLEALSEHISQLLLQQSMIVSPQMQPRLFEQTAHYVTKQIKALSHHPVDEKETFEKLCQHLNEQCERQLTQKFEGMIEAARRLVNDYPASQQEQASEALQEALGTLGMVHAAPQELRGLICQPQDTQPQQTQASESISEQALSMRLGDLAMAISPKHAGQNTLTLLQALHRAAPKAASVPNEKVQARSIQHDEKSVLVSADEARAAER